MVDVDVDVVVVADRDVDVVVEYSRVVSVFWRISLRIIVCTVGLDEEEDARIMKRSCGVLNELVVEGLFQFHSLLDWWLLQ